MVVAVATSLILATIGSVLAWRSYEDRVAREQDLIAETAVEAAVATEQFFAARIAVLESVAQIPAMANEEVENMPPLLEAAAIQQLGFSGGVGWVDRGGVMRAHSSSEAMPLDLSDRAFVRNVLDSGVPVVGDVVVGELSGEVLVIIAVPTSSDGRVNGAVVGALRADRFDIKVPRLVRPRYEIYVLGQEGQVIIVDGHVGPLTEPVNQGMVAAETSGLGTGVLGAPDRIFAVTKVDDARWTIVVEQDRSLILSGSRSRFFGEVAVLVLLGLLTIAGALVAARRINASNRQIIESGRGLEALESLSEALSAAPETADVAEAALEVFGRVFDTELVAVGLIDRNSRMRVHVITDRLDTGGTDIPDELVPLTTSTVLTDAYSHDGPLVLSAAELTERYPRLRLESDVSGAMVLRFTGRNAHGVVGIFLRNDFPPPGPDVELFSRMVPLLGDAFGRASAAENERLASRAFQHALLPRDTIALSVGLQRAVRYMAAVGDVEVGGDWYDLWMIDEHRVGAVVGDVVGRGVEAAATMGQLRSALRATVATASTPGEALANLDGLTGHISGASSATVILGELEPATGVVRLASAGHLPPIVARGGNVEVLYEVKGTPIGFLKQKTRRRTSEIRLGPEDTLVLYTDGLVERRSETIDDGIERLRGIIEKNLDVGVEALADAILKDCLELDHRDDVALIILRPVGSRPRHFTRSAPVDDFSELLAELRAWLDDQPEPVAGTIMSRVEEALDTVVAATASDPSGDVVVAVDTASSEDELLMTIEYRRGSFGPETDRINRLLLRQWEFGELAMSGPRMRFAVGSSISNRPPADFSRGSR